MTRAPAFSSTTSFLTPHPHSSPSARHSPTQATPSPSHALHARSATPSGSGVFDTRQAPLPLRHPARREARRPGRISSHAAAAILLPAAVSGRAPAGSHFQRRP